MACSPFPDYVFAKPKEGNKCWGSEYKRKTKIVSLWMPICPKYYEAIGFVVKDTDTLNFEHKLDETYRCVRG